VAPGPPVRLTMRYGLLSDVHANRQALESAMEFLSRQRVDAVLCAGDLVGAGAAPDACVRDVISEAAGCVAGNHDLAVLGELPDARLSPQAWSSVAWTRTQLSPESWDRLSALPLVFRGPDGVMVAHGSLDDPQRYVQTGEEAHGQLARLASEGPEWRILVLGHTHQPLAAGERSGIVLDGGEGTVRLRPGERWLINPGSVGQAREWRVYARIAILDLGRATVSFRGLRYDTAGCRRELRRHGLDPSSCHLRPQPSQIALGRLRRVASRGVRAIRRRSM
jgi:predicted phosphodiesterase